VHDNLLRLVASEGVEQVLTNGLDIHKHFGSNDRCSLRKPAVRTGGGEALANQFAAVGRSHTMHSMPLHHGGGSGAP